MSVEIKEEIDVKISGGTGVTSVQTVITTVDTRTLTISFTAQDEIRKRDERMSWERIKSYGFFSGVAGGVVGGAALIILGIENFNPEQIAVGAGAVALGKYFLRDARSHLYEVGLAGREKNKIKNTH